MTVNDVVKKAWLDAGLFKSPSPDLKAFLDLFDGPIPGCWDEAMSELRTRCPAEVERLVMPVWNLGERMYRLCLIGAMDANQAGERALLGKLAGACDARKDTFALQMILHKDHPELLDPVEQTIQTDAANSPATESPGRAVGTTGHLGALRMLVAMKRALQPNSVIDR